MLNSCSFLLLSALLTRFLHATTTCYHPDGSAVNDPAVQPCNPVGGNTISMCCSLNRTSFPDQCLSNGLCGGGGNLFRDSCTDKTWKSPLCLNLCTSGGGLSSTAVGVTEPVTQNYTESDVQVTDCNDGSYCCGPKNSTCCERGEGKHIASILEAPTSTSSVTSTTSTATTTSVSSSNIVSTSSLSPTATGSSNGGGSSSGLSKGAIAGIVVGCIIALLIAGAALWYLFNRKRRTSSNVAELDPHPLEIKGVIHEKPGTSRSTELWHREPHVELDAAATRGSEAELEG